MSGCQLIMCTSYLQGQPHCNESTVNKRSQLKARDSCLSAPFFVYYPDTSDPSYVVSCQPRVSCFLLSAHEPLLFTMCMMSCHPPLPLFLCSFLATCLLGQYFAPIICSQSLGVLNWHPKKIFFLTSCCRCFYILVKLFLYGIGLKMERKKKE